MGKTVIEELVISLGLDAKELQDSKAIEAINTIRQSVTMLNGDLKETEKLLSSIGKVKFGSGTARTSRTKKPTEQDMIGMTAFPRKPTIAPQPDKPIKVELPKDKKPDRDKGKDKGPTSVKSLLTGMGGALGQLAAGVYLFKSISEGIAKLYDATTQFLSIGQKSKNVAEAIGLTAEQMEAFGSVAKALGKDSEQAIAEIDAFGKDFASIIPGQFHQGLAALGIVPFDEKGEMRPYEDVLKEVFDKAASMEGSKVYKKRVLRETVGFSEGTSEMAMMGWERFQNLQKGLVRGGFSASEEQIQKEAQLSKVKALSGMKAGMIGRKLGDAFSDPLVNAFSAIMGTEGISEGLTKYLQMKPDELRSALKNANIPDASRKSIMEFLNIREPPQQVRLQPGQAMSCVTGQPENLIVNLNVDRDKAKVDASVNNKPLKNVRVNLAPNFTGQ